MVLLLKSKTKNAISLKNRVVFSEDPSIKGRGISISCKNNYGDNVNGIAIYIESLSGDQFCQTTNAMIESCILKIVEQ